MRIPIFNCSIVGTLASLILAQTVYSQGIGINETGANPDPSAILDASSTTKGFLPPRMTITERDAIQNPAEGLQIYNTTTKCIEVYISPNWQHVFCGCSSAPSNLSYTDNGPLAYCLNEGIAPNNASTQSSAPGSYSVTPALPAGLQLNNVNGQITGTPTSLSSASNYTIVGSNACGVTTLELNIEVITIPAMPSVISGPDAPTINSSSNYHITAVSGATSYAWTVPSGWTINSGQGTTLINVTAAANAGNVTVAASNSCGTSSASTRAVTSWHPIVATGGTITNYTADGTNGVNGVQYRVHSFIAVGSSGFNITDAGTEGKLDYLVVAGGGGGGRYGGGGGAGGAVYSAQFTIQPGSYPIEVGAGGAGWIGGAQAGGNGASGELSSFGNIIALGGGGGGNYGNTNNPGVNCSPGATGGSGGGGGCSNQSQPNIGCAGGSGSVGQGNAGSAGTGTLYRGGAGGGAGVAGAPATGSGKGGDGLSYDISGGVIYYAGGGGGGGDGYGANGTNLGGLGGGGRGARGNNLMEPSEIDGQSNTGGGGGGGADNSVSGTVRAGNGGSGIVIIRYPLTNPNQ